jgi:hypothetical protein
MHRSRSKFPLILALMLLVAAVELAVAVAPGFAAPPQQQGQALSANPIPTDVPRPAEQDAIAASGTGAWGKAIPCRCCRKTKRK